MLFKEKVIFKQYIPMKYKHFGLKIYNLCDMICYTYDTNIHMGKDK